MANLFPSGNRLMDDFYCAGAQCMKFRLESGLRKSRWLNRATGFV